LVLIEVHFDIREYCQAPKPQGVPQRADQQARQLLLEIDGGQAGSYVGLPVGNARRFKRKKLGHLDIRGG
jgi:hypothetical protein